MGPLSVDILVPVYFSNELFNWSITYRSYVV